MKYMKRHGAYWNSLKTMMLNYGDIRDYQPLHCRYNPKID